MRKDVVIWPDLFVSSIQYNYENTPCAVSPSNKDNGIKSKSKSKNGPCVKEVAVLMPNEIGADHERLPAAANFQLQDTQKSSVMEASTMGASTSYAHLFGNIKYWCGEPFCSL
jgi:hypothetical protein